MAQASILKQKIRSTREEALEVRPQLINELKQFGIINPEICYNCGMCVAVCGQSGMDHNFPRRTIRCVQLGLEKELLTSVDPWLCYYCGDCTDSCPREAEPAEMMMAIRRWTIAKYDPTGLSWKMYTSFKSFLLISAFWALLPVVGLLILHFLGYAEVVTDSVQLNKFAPVEIIWFASHIYGLYLATVLLIGGYRMHKQVMAEDFKKIDVKKSDYFFTAKEFLDSFFTQRKWRKCGSKEIRRWLRHFLLFISYATMFTLIVGFLWWFQTDEIYPLTHPQRWIGYLATLLLLYTTLDIIIGRIRKRAQIHRFSHHSDWVFPVSLFLVVVSGIFVHVLRYMALPWPTYIMYTFHLMVSTVMLSTEVGVGKWSHLLYRPLAHYLDAVKQRASTRGIASI